MKSRSQVVEGNNEIMIFVSCGHLGSLGSTTLEWVMASAELNPCFPHEQNSSWKSTLMKGTFLL